MKHKIYYILLLCFCALSPILAQSVPEAFNYQGVAFDTNGTIVNSQQIRVKFTISTDNGSEVILYSEDHSLLTSNLGYFSAEIGRGNSIQGVFENISWQNGSYFLNVGLDISNSANYTDAGTVLIQSVPYSLVAKNSGNQPIGLSGNQGPTGEIGAQGLPGPQGAQGPSGTIGIICFPWDGTIGPPGAAGLTGMQGPYGPPGEPGIAGATGSPGQKGDNFGPAGPKGVSGPPGEKGGIGLEGQQGIQGPIAENGVAGPVGNPGPIGEGGGPEGAPGPWGQPGPQGLPGLPAPAGEKGPQGHSRFVMTNQAPTSTNFQNIYLDDGTNRQDGKPGFKFWNGMEWVDIKTTN